MNLQYEHDNGQTDWQIHSRDKHRQIQYIDKNERWVMYLVYLWHASTWPWEGGIRLRSSSGPRPSHRSRPGCWAAPQTEEALREEEWTSEGVEHTPSTKDKTDINSQALSSLGPSLMFPVWSIYFSQHVVRGIVLPLNWNFNNVTSYTDCDKMQ